MTKVLEEGVGWVDIGLVLDWSTTQSVGYSAGVPCTARQWLAALGMAGNRQCLDGARAQGVFLLSANGCQPTAVACIEACTTLGIQHTFTSDNNSQDKADTERMMRTLKEAGLWLQEWTRPYDLMSAFETWMAYDNNHDLHSALGDKTPRPFELDYQHSHCTPFVAA